MHTENKSITPSEKACLLVSRRRPCPIDRGNPLSKEWQKARQIGATRCEKRSRTDGDQETRIQL